MTIKSLENKLHEENLVHQSIIKHHIDEDLVRTTSFFLSLSPSRQSCFTLLQEKNTKIESLAAQVADLTQQVQMQEQLKKDLIQEKASASQLKEQHSIEVTKQKAMLEDACKHYQNTLKEEQLKLELMSQQLESAKSDIVAMNSKASKRDDDLEAQKALVMELQDHISSLEKDLEEIRSEKKCLEQSHAETSHLLSIAQQSASKNLAHDQDTVPQPLMSAHKVSTSSAGAPSDKFKSVQIKKTVHHFDSFNASPSPPSAVKQRESPKTKKRDKSKVDRSTHAPNCRRLYFSFVLRRLKSVQGDQLILENM